MTPITIAIGYDPRESIAFYVLAHSILRRASRPVKIVPLALSMMGNGLHDRPRNQEQSTDFTFTRFLTPYLGEFNGVSIFMDCDMLCLGDVAELEEVARSAPYHDVFVVKHDYTPSSKVKFLNQIQTLYPRKNWSSVMVFNGHRMACKRLTPDYVDKATPMALHQFQWADEVGELAPEWNHLVGEQVPNDHAKLVHFTQGGPWFKEYEHSEYSTEWFHEYHDMLHPM